MMSAIQCVLVESSGPEFADQFVCKSCEKPGFGPQNKSFEGKKRDFSRLASDRDESSKDSVCLPTNPAKSIVAFPGLKGLLIIAQGSALVIPHIFLAADALYASRRLASH